MVRSVAWVGSPMTSASINQNVHGILLRCGAIACFSLMTAALKWASEGGASTIEMLFFRGLVGAPLVLAWLALGPGIHLVRTTRPAAHLFRGVIGCASLWLVLEGLVRLPIADAATIGFSAPAFATLLSALLLGEKIGRYRWGAVALGFLGVVIVTQPAAGALSTIGIICALGGAIGHGATSVTIRQLGGSEEPAAIAFWFLVFLLVIGTAGMILVAGPHRPLTWALLLFAGVIGAVSQLLITQSLHRAPVSVVVPFDYSQIIWASLLGWMIWETIPGIHTLIGASLIAASGVFTAWREHRLGRDSRAAAVPVE